MKYSLKTILLIVLGTVLLGVMMVSFKDILVSQLRQSFSGECNKCNVILISIDTLRADHIGTYGYTKNTSPHLDEFAKGAIVLENAYAAAPWTLPSHAAMLAGDYPWNLGIQTFTDTLPQKVVTLAEVLKGEGYKTAGISGGAFVGPRFAFDQGFDEFEKLDEWQDAELIFGKAGDWLSSHKDDNFFLFLHTFEVHDPYSPPQLYIDSLNETYKGEINKVDISLIARVNRGEVKLSETDLQRFIDLYDGEIIHLDSILGQFFQTLDELGLSKNTIVVITSDHGEEFGERGLWGVHAYSLYNELLHVPLIIKAPQLEPRREKKLTSLIDVPSIVLELLALKSPPEFKGQSLEKSDPNRILLASTTALKELILNIDKSYGLYRDLIVQERTDETPIPPFSRAAFLGNWKLIKNEDSTLELYNLADDSSEKNNLIDSFEELSQTNRDLLLLFDSLDL